MTMMLDREAVAELQANTIAVSMSQKRFGNSKKLDDRIHKRASDAVNADPKWLKTKEIILHTDHPAYRAVLQHMDTKRKEFKERTVAYPEPKIRLLRLDKLDIFQMEINQAQRQLDDLVEEMDACRDFMVSQARDALRDAFNPQHYPQSFADCFSIEVDYPMLGPDDRLQRLNPELYQRQVERFLAMMDAAIEETSLALASELEKVFGSLARSLESGRQIKAESFVKLNNLIERFEDVRIGTSANVQAVIDQARQIMQGRTITELERSVTARNAVARSLAPLHETVVSMTEPIEERFIEL